MRPRLNYFPRKKSDFPFSTAKPKFANEPEQLSGQVKGMPASDLEERYFKAVAKSRKTLEDLFRLSLGGPRGTPGWLELDGLHKTFGGWKAVEIDDISFVHKGEGEKQEALLKDIRRVEGLKKMGIMLTPWYNGQLIQHVTNEDLGTQADADRWVKDNL